MCVVNPNIKYKPFDLENELVIRFGEKKTKEIISEIRNEFEEIFPIIPICFKMVGSGYMFDERGEVFKLNFYDDGFTGYRYLIEFEKNINENFKQTFIYVFN